MNNAVNNVDKKQDARPIFIFYKNIMYWIKLCIEVFAC